MTSRPDDPIELTSQIRRRLRQRRKDLRFSQKAVALRLGISQTNITRIEDAEHENPKRTHISRKHFLGMAQLFECSEDYLRCKTDNPDFSEQAPLTLDGIPHALSAAVDNGVRPSSRASQVHSVESALPISTVRAFRRAFFDEVFKLDYDKAEYDADLAEAVALSISGTNLRRVIVDGRIAGIIQMLERLVAEEKVAQKEGRNVSDHVVQILMHHPRSNVMRTAMIQDQGAAARDIVRYQQVVHRNLCIFCLLRERYPTKLLIRTMNYMPAYGLDLFRYSDDEKGVCYVREYPLPDPDETYKDKPISRLTPADGEWYSRRAEQFERLWNGVGKELRKSYPWRATIASMKAKRELRPELLAIFEKVAVERKPRK